MSAGCHGSSNIAKTRGHAKAAGTSSSPRPPRSTSLLVGAVDLQCAVAPMDLVMEVLEDLDGATRGQAPRAMQDVVLERGPDLRPPRGDRALEVLRHHRGELCQAALGIVEQRPRGLRDRRALEAPADLPGDLLVRRRAHAGQLVVELGQRGRGGRRHEVGRVAVGRRRGQQVEQLVVEALQAPARRACPGQMQRVRGGVAQDVGAPVQVEERRDRKARADQVLVAEAEADHEPILPQPSAESESSTGAGAGYAASSSSVRAGRCSGCLATVCISATTTAGSNWSPAQRSSSATASATGIAAR